MWSVSIWTADFYFFPMSFDLKEDFNVFICAILFYQYWLWIKYFFPCFFVLLLVVLQVYIPPPPPPPNPSYLKFTIDCYIRSVQFVFFFSFYRSLSHWFFSVLHFILCNCHFMLPNKNLPKLDLYILYCYYVYFSLHVHETCVSWKSEETNVKVCVTFTCYEKAVKWSWILKCDLLFK